MAEEKAERLDREFSPQFVKGVFNAAAAAFSKSGWKKRKSNIFSIDVDDEIYGCVGLNKSLYRGGILNINPFVSVGHHEVEKLVTELLEIKFTAYTTACIGMTVGYLMPEQKYATWSFQMNSQYEDRVAEMVACTVSFGRPFMEQNATLRTLYETLLRAKRGTPPDPYDYRVAAAAHLLGEEVETFLAERLREIGDRNDEAAKWFRKFAMNLLHR